MTSSIHGLVPQYIVDPSLSCVGGTYKTCSMGTLWYGDYRYEVAALPMIQYPDQAKNAKQLKRFKSELENITLLNERFPSCKYFVKLVLAHETTFYFERCLGDLETLLINDAFPMTRRKCTWDDRVKIAHSVLIALNILHKNKLLHSDVKPENILVTDNPPSIKLCDWQFLCSSESPEARIYAGTFCYASPQCCLALANYSYTITQDESVFSDEIWKTGVVIQLLLLDKAYFWIEKGANLFERDDIMGAPAQTQYEEIVKYCSDETRFNFLGLTHFDPKARPSLEEALKDFDSEVSFLSDSYIF